MRVINHPGGIDEATSTTPSVIYPDLISLAAHFTASTSQVRLLCEGKSVLRLFSRLRVFAVVQIYYQR